MTNVAKFILIGGVVLDATILSLTAFIKTLNWSNFSLNIFFSVPASVERSQTPEKVAKPDVSTLPGQATLTCFGSGNPEPLFRWQRNGDDVTGKIIR